MTDSVRREIADSLAVLTLVADDDHLISQISRVGKVCAGALSMGNKIMLAGNGGSAADSQHIAAEFISRLSTDRAPLPALALTTDSSILTAAANDYGFETVFARQIAALARARDIFIGISTSGKSLNVLRALEEARRRQVTTVGLTGKTGGEMLGLCDYIVKVPSVRTQNIQEIHIMIGHIICSVAEQDFLPRAPLETISEPVKVY